MEKSVKWPVREPMPSALVEYYPEGQVLLIENGQMSASGEEMARDIIVHYDKDEPDAPRRPQRFASTAPSTF